MNTQALANALNKLNNSTKYTTNSLKRFAATFQWNGERKSSPLLARHRQRRHHR